MRFTRQLTLVVTSFTVALAPGRLAAQAQPAVPPGVAVAATRLALHGIRLTDEQRVAIHGVATAQQRHLSQLAAARRSLVEQTRAARASHDTVAARAGVAAVRANRRQTANVIARRLNAVRAQLTPQQARRFAFNRRTVRARLAQFIRNGKF